MVCVTVIVSLVVKSDISAECFERIVEYNTFPLLKRIVFHCSSLYVLSS